MPRGVKPKYSEKEIRKAFIKHSGNITHAAKEVGCHPGTMRYRIGKSKKLKETLDKCRGSVYIRTHEVLVGHLEHKDPKIQQKAAIHYQKILGGRYGWTENAPQRERKHRSVKEFLGIE